MLYPTAGSRLFVADAPADQAGAFPSGGWVEIGETEALGVMGVSSDLIDVTAIGDDGQKHVKGLVRRTAMQVILGDDPADAGQAVLWAASRSRQVYPFRLSLSSGHVREWFALVVGISEVFDSANNVMRLQVDLQPVGNIQRSEAL